MPHCGKELIRHPGTQVSQVIYIGSRVRAVADAVSSAVEEVLPDVAGFGKIQASVCLLGRGSNHDRSMPWSLAGCGVASCDVANCNVLVGFDVKPRKRTVLVSRDILGC